MKLQLIVIGKTAFPFVKEGEELYAKRIQKYHPIELITIPNIKKSQKLSQNELKKQEGQLILNTIKPGDHLVLLDEKGKSFSSLDFAKYIQHNMNHIPNPLVFVIGGAYGFSKEVYQRANERLSLSKMTFSHQIIRVIFLEQLYRAFSIIRGGPYHHE